MLRTCADRPWTDVRPFATSCCIALMAMLTACGGSTRRTATPHSKTTITAATVAPRVERLVIVERGSISMVARGGCVAMVRTAENDIGTQDELRVRCPKPDRLKTWFDGTERVTSTIALEPMSDDEDDDAKDVKLPLAKLLTASGKTLKTAKPEDAERLAAEVRALSAELAVAEQVAPGPASANGWQMLHVMGPAHVLLAGTPARGVFEARVSTNGQYLCEFTTNIGGDGPMRATKSGWLTPSTASHAIDEVLGPFAETTDTPKTTFAAGTKSGAEKQSNVVSTAAVFERFAEMQDALGDACLPELEPPSTPPVGL
jgi:hypothetical protein